MISDVNKNAVGNLAALAEDKGVELAAHDESILVLGVDSSMPISPVVSEGQTALETLIVNTAEGNTDHEEVIEDYARVVGEGILAQVTLAKDVVVPFVKLISDNTVAKVAESVIKPYAINQVYLAEIHDAPSVYEMLSEYEGIPRSEVMMPRGLPLIDEVDLINNIMIGSSVLDKLLVKMLAGHEEGWALEVYTKHFCSNVESTKLFAIEVMEMDELLLVYLICSHLVKGELDLKEVYPGLLLETVLLNYRNQAATSMLSIHKNWDGMKASGLLVLNYPITSYIPEADASTQIDVIGATYEDFLGAGGSPETIIGSCVSSRKYLTADILAIKDSLEQHYSDYTIACDDELTKRAGTIIRESSVDAVKENLGSLATNTLADGLEDPLACEQAFHKIISRFQDSELKKDLYGCIRIAVCEAFFGDTSALEILARMDAYMLTYKDMEARAAIYYVVVDMVVAHLTQQVVTK